MKRALLVVVGVVLLLGAEAAKKNGSKKELEKFNGTWKAVSIEHDGKEVPKEKVETVTLVVKGEHYTFTVGDQKIEGTHKLNPSKNPKEIDAVRSAGEHAGETFKGIYTLDDDNYKVCFGEPGKDRPTEFSTKSGGGQRLLVLKREKP